MKKFIKFTNVRVFAQADHVRYSTYNEFIVDADKIETLTSYNGIYLCIANLSFMRHEGSETRTVNGRVDIYLSANDYQMAKRELLLTIPEAIIEPQVDVVPCDVTRDPVDAEEIASNLRVGDCERELIIRALKMCGGRRKEAAARLGLSERTLYRKMKEYNL